MRRVRILASLIGMIMLFSVLSAGVAFAHPVGAEHAFTDHGLDGSAPIGSHISGPGFANGPGVGPASGPVGNNPLCPRHHDQHVDA